MAKKSNVLKAFEKANSTTPEQYVMSVIGKDPYLRRSGKNAKSVQEAIGRFRLNSSDAQYDEFVERAYWVDTTKIYEELLDDSVKFEKIYEEYLSKHNSISKNISEFIESVYTMKKIRDNVDAQSSDLIWMLKITVDRSLLLLDKLYKKEMSKNNPNQENLDLYKKYAKRIYGYGSTIFRLGIRKRDITSEFESEFTSLLRKEANLSRAVAHDAYDQIKNLNKVRSEIIDLIYHNESVTRNLDEKLDKEVENVHTPEQALTVGADAVSNLKPIIVQSVKIKDLRNIKHALDAINKKGEENQRIVDYHKLSQSQRYIYDGIRQMKSHDVVDWKKQKEIAEKLKKKRAKADERNKKARVLRWTKSFLNKYYDMEYHILVNSKGLHDIHITFGLKKDYEYRNGVLRKIEKWATPSAPSGSPRSSVPIDTESIAKNWEDIITKNGQIRYGNTPIDDIIGPIIDAYFEEISKEEEDDLGGAGSDEEPDEVPSFFLSRILDVEKKLGLTKVVNDVITLFTDAMKTLGECIDNIFQDILPTINEFEDFFNAPIDAIIKVISVALSIVSVGTTGIEISIGVFAKGVNLLFNPNNSDDDDDDDDDSSDDSESPALSFLKVAVNFFIFILEGVAFSIKAVQSVISFGLGAFTNTMSNILKLVKAIAKTSPLMEQVFNGLNLVYTMFTLPFSIVFGDTMLDYVFQIVLYARDMGMSMVFYWQQHADALDLIKLCIYDNAENIKEVATTFIKDVLPDLITFMGDTFVFVSYFLETFLSKESNLIETMQAGINLARALIAHNIITIFFTAAIKVTKFISENADKVLGIMRTGFNIAKWCIGCMDEIMEYFHVFCVAVGTVVVSILSALGGAIMGSRHILKIAKEVGLKPISEEFFKALIPYIDKGGIIGAVGGAVIGEVLYRLLFSFGEGGYIPATDGGMLAIVAEKETEYVVPESKMYIVRGRRRIVINYNGTVYGIDSDGQAIRDSLSRLENYSSYR